MVVVVVDVDLSTFIALDVFKFASAVVVDSVILAVDGSDCSLEILFTRSLKLITASLTLGKKVRKENADGAFLTSEAVEFFITAAGFSIFVFIIVDVEIDEVEVEVGIAVFSVIDSFVIKLVWGIIELVMDTIDMGLTSE